MTVRRTSVRAAMLALALAGTHACAQPDKVETAAAVAPAGEAYDASEWTYWGGDAGQTRYAPLDQIHADNVQQLQIAWRWSADTSGSPESSNYKATPLLDDGVLYVPWVNHGAAAIDAGTGKTIWTYQPEQIEIGGRGASLAPRSLAYWTDGEVRRVFHNSIDGRLLAIDGKTGEAVREFGKDGVINLRHGLVEGRAVQDVGSVSPALVVGDVIVVQVIPGGSRNKESTPGDIRGFDVRTGKLLWTFHTVPRKGEYGYETWENNSADYIGNVGVWSMMSADPETGYVYLPTETPSNDFWGGHRLGDGLFAESLLCLDTKTGKRVWHFQFVHHGVWDYDAPAAPLLHDIVKDGKRVKAVTLLTKQNLSFVFDRITGEAVWPIEERVVPQTRIPGERLSPTQPFPTRPAPYSTLGYREDDLIDFTPALRAEAVKIAGQYAKGPLYEPMVEIKPGVKGAWIYPGYGGGSNWNGAAFDPETGIMYVPVRHKPYAAGLAKGDPAKTNLGYTQSGNHVIGGPQGLPILKPPYSELVATDMNAGVHLWRIPTGKASDFIRNHPALKGLNLNFDSMGQYDIRPSPLLTSRLLFLGESGNLAGGSGGPMLRAYDKTDGRAVWEMAMPTLVTGAPMTYMHDGRQYVVAAVSALGQPAEIVAVTLGGGSGNGAAAPAGGVALAAAPASATAVAAAIEAAPGELTLGEATFARTCAICHGPAGAGLPQGAAPPLTGRVDFANVTRAIAQGAGEMPAMANMLTPAEIDAIGKYVVKTLGAPRARAGGGPVED
ncbi:MAG: PQQ-binding-like beta-propeller repeat protein [Alphaproteobacteria bacterium]|nr:PQQ-binding-like beta-propeller repeat protein [Alphaproteobacteria bacterium]